jgi:8-oxo-dGTP pyrophosphatase MutT (NUDIX family)
VLGRSWRGAQELQVIIEEPDGRRTVRALAYPRLTGAPEPGDRVLLNTGALDLGLGTGGYALVVAIPDRLPPDPSGPGHLIKARYTPLQASVLGADEQDSEFHETLRDADDLDGMPVVVADLHSALPAILAGYLAGRDAAAPQPSLPRARVGYVMLDGGALPAWFSRTTASLTEAGWLTGTVTVGQAFGGDLETVSLHSGLLAVRHVLHADLAIVAQGPGNLGTGTRWGFSGVASGEAINAAAVLSGQPVGSLRISQADPRPRHRGISHHSLTSYGRVALARAEIVVPELDGEFGARVLAAAAPLAARHRLVRVSVAGLAEALRESPVRLATMGRDLDQDPAYFLAAAAAGRHAATLPGRTDPRLRYDPGPGSVRIVLQDSAGAILLRSTELAPPAAGHSWELPGGGIEPAESYQQAAARQLAEQTGLRIDPAAVGPPRWRRTAAAPAPGGLRHELVAGARLAAARPQLSAAARWWTLPELASSSERFYPGRLPQLLPAFLAGAELAEPLDGQN